MYKLLLYGKPVVQEDALNRFVYEALCHLYGIDVLAAMWIYHVPQRVRYSIENPGVFNMRGMFTTSVPHDNHWFRRPFRIGRNDYYLSVDWYRTPAPTHIKTWPDFQAMIECCYGGRGYSAV